MPKQKQELPKQIKNNVSKEGQEIWMKTYNSAKEHYSDNPDQIKGDDQDAESAAAATAWKQLEQMGFEKDSDGIWRK
jgi:cation transport regulator ChaB